MAMLRAELTIDRDRWHQGIKRHLRSRHTTKEERQLLRRISKLVDKH